MLRNKMVGKVLSYVLLMFIAGCGDSAPTVSDPTGAAPILSQTISPTDSEQTIDAGNNLKVIVPGGLLAKSQTLSIGSISDPQPMNMPNFQTVLAAYRIELGDMHNVAESVIIEVPYDPAKLDPSLDPEKVLFGAYYDTEQNTWYMLPSYVDTTRNVLLIHTQHFSDFIVGTSFTMPGIVNSRFALWYDKSEVQANTGSVGTSGWYKTFDPLTTEHWLEVPGFVEDIWFHVTHSYEQYVTVYKLHELAEGDPLRPLTIRAPIGIWVGGNGSPYRSPITGNLSISFSAGSYNTLRHSVAHELFHCIQGEYYTPPGMTARKWWIEATADYAADKLAWADAGGTGLMGGEKIYIRYLEWPLDSSYGLMCSLLEMAGGSWPEHGYHEYTTAFFVDFLVRKKGINFVDMWKKVAESWSTGVLGVLDGYLTGTLGAGNGIESCYRQFADYWLFGSDSPIRGQLISGGMSSAAHEVKAIYALSETKRIITDVLQYRYSAELLRIPIEYKANTKRNLLIGVDTSLYPALTVGLSVQVYAIGSDSVEEARLIGTLDQATAQLNAAMDPGEDLYMLMINASGDSAKVDNLVILGELAIPDKTETVTHDPCASTNPPSLTMVSSGSLMPVGPKGSVYEVEIGSEQVAFQKPPTRVHAVEIFGDSVRFTFDVKVTADTSPFECPSQPAPLTMNHDVISEVYILDARDGGPAKKTMEKITSANGRFEKTFTRSDNVRELLLYWQNNMIVTDVNMWGPLNYAPYPISWSVNVLHLKLTYK